jgi:hypothetical protein
MPTRHFFSAWFLPHSWPAQPKPEAQAPEDAQIAEESALPCPGQIAPDEAAADILPASVESVA